MSGDGAPATKWLTGSPSCQGCSSELLLRKLIGHLSSDGKKVAVVSPACCANVYPMADDVTRLENGIWMNVPFASGAAVASAVSRSLPDYRTLVFAGDGGTFDIGLQALSGAAERDEDILYVCYDNEAYMNTGTQSSSATPRYARTTTSPSGKEGRKKDIMAVMTAHRISYAATVSPSYGDDLERKTKKAMKREGTKFFHALIPCPPGWGFEPRQNVRVGREVVKSGLWGLYEVEREEENGMTRMVMKVSQPSKSVAFFGKRKGVKEYLSLQGRFKGMSEEEVRRVDEEAELNLNRLMALDGKDLLNPVGSYSSPLT